jgi:uncharacterized cupin superfamily protein
MERASIEASDAVDGDGPIDARNLADALGTTHVAITHYRLPPGAWFPAGLHAHQNQEEVFLVVEGAATFETLSGDVTVESGDAIRFDRGEFHAGRNDADRDLVVLALGAPRESADVRIPVSCPEYGREDLGLRTSDDGVTFACPTCGAERTPVPCPGCGHDDLRVTLGAEMRPVVVCRGCDSRFENPPTRDEW